MKSISSRQILKMLKADGWVEMRVRGSHHQLRHPVKKGIVTVKHPIKDMPPKTVRSIERQSGLKFE
ncbi:MAG: type II toxin-antitoxin system HicA family toxin [Peptococcaceae bacterium]|nr:type II toxin-antitoxin system HicA family toxin [Peptococcaceae bacterium]